MVGTIDRKIRTGLLFAFQTRKFVSIFAAGVMLMGMGASPAAAQGTAASTQITSAIRSADETQTPLNEGDDEFRQLPVTFDQADRAPAGYAPDAQPAWAH